MSAKLSLQEQRQQFTALPAQEERVSVPTILVTSNYPAKFAAD
jgi:hypothetical protein